MAANYVLIGEITTTVTTASITFSNIPQTGYTDLLIKISARGTAANIYDWLNVSFNSTSTGYGYTLLQGDGSGAYSYNATVGTNQYAGDVTNANATASTFTNYEMYIANYNSTSTYKSYSVDCIGENNGTSSVLDLNAGLWSNNAAISTITFTPRTSNFVANSTFSLYGVAALGTTPTVLPKASGGDIVVNDGTYWYHAFLNTGTFTTTQTLSCDILQIGSGGGGGSNRGGGGGAGGIRLFTSQSLVAGSYIAAVGAGGSGGGGTSGNASQFHNFTVSPGGGRGGNSQGAGLTGASGGGGGNELQSNPTPAGGGATLGNVGGTCDPSNKLTTGGGGGGFGSAGGNGSSSTGGAGGAGVNTYSAWATATGTGVSGFYAGGGGGYGSGSQGPGGSGGGGTGGAGTANNGSSGVIATGSGGGATNDSGVAYNGGSGLVIVRYAV